MRGKQQKQEMGRILFSSVLFQKGELSEFCAKLGELCEKLGEFVLAHKQ